MNNKPWWQPTTHPCDQPCIDAYGWVCVLCGISGYNAKDIGDVLKKVVTRNPALHNDDDTKSVNVKQEKADLAKERYIQPTLYI